MTEGVKVSAYKSSWRPWRYPSEQILTCLKLPTQTQGHGEKYVQSWQQSPQKDSNGVVQMSLLLTLNILHTLF